MKGQTVIIFNDLVVGKTDRPVSYERENDSQKEYRFTNLISQLTASLFCEHIDVVENKQVIVEVS